MNILTRTIASAISVLSPSAATTYINDHRKFEMVRDYQSAKTNGPNQLWNPTTRSGDAELRLGGKKTRQRVQDLERNNAHVSGAIRRAVANIVGEGNFPQSKVRLPGGKGIDQKIADQIEQPFLTWAENCCLNGDSLVDAQILGQRHKMMDGEYFCVQSVIDKQLKIQIIEADQLAEEIDGPMPNMFYAVKGIELDPYGRPVNYHFREVHPGDNSRFSSKINVIPASRVFHVFERGRASASRGISVFASVVMNLFDIGELSDSTMTLARLATAYGIIIETESPDDEINAPGTGTTGSGLVNNERFKYINPGGFHYVSPGQKVTMISPENPGPIYEPFMRTNLRACSVGIGQSYSALSGDYSQGNFSSERQAMLLERALFRMETALNDRKFNEPLYRGWMVFSILNGKLKLPNYEANKENYRRVKFSRPKQEYINPVQDITAAVMAKNNNLISLTEMIEDRGQDRDDVFNAIADDRQAQDALGILPQPKTPPAETKGTF